MARQQKYETPTQQLSVRVPAHLMQGLDREAQERHRPRAEIVVMILTERYGPPKVHPSPFD